MERAEERLKFAEGAEVVNDKKLRKAKDDVSLAHKLLQGQELGLRLAKREEQGDEFDQSLYDAIDTGVITCSLSWIASNKTELKIRSVVPLNSLSSDQLQKQAYCQHCSMEILAKNM